MTQYHGTGPVERRKRVTFYGCTTHRKRGACICSNAVVLRQEIVDTVVLSNVADVLNARGIDAAIDKAIARLRASQERHLDRRTRIEQELSAVEARLGRLMEALLRGGSLETVVAQIKVEEQRKRVLRTELEGLASAARVAVLDASQIGQQRTSTSLSTLAVSTGNRSLSTPLLRSPQYTSMSDERGSTAVCPRGTNADPGPNARCVISSGLGITPRKPPTPHRGGSGVRSG
jgi:hypothetical protein